MARRCTYLFALLALVAALFALPQAARAHSGYMHAAHAHVHAMKMHAADMHAADLHVASARAVAAPDAPAKPRAAQSLTADLQSLPAGIPDPPCSGLGCCLHCPCAACASVVAPTLPVLLPPLHRAKASDYTNSICSGIDGPSLRRPPKSFA